MKKSTNQAVMHGAIIAGVMGVCAALVIADILEPLALVFAAAACYVSARYLWIYFMDILHSPVRVLKKVLPKVGFNIENIEWSDDKSSVSMIGKYQDDSFVIEAAPGYAFFTVTDMPWHTFNVDDPNMPRILEAINATNASCTHMSVILCNPDEEGNRVIYTKSSTLLPHYRTADYMQWLLTDILRRKHDLAEQLRQSRPWLDKQSRPIGFTAPDDVA